MYSCGQSREDIVAGPAFAWLQHRKVSQQENRMGISALNSDITRIHFPGVDARGCGNL